MQNSPSQLEQQAMQQQPLGAGATALSAVFGILVGVVVGVVTTFTHGLLFPGGLIAGLAIVLALVAGFRLIFESRIVAAAAAVGVLGASVALALPGAGGIVLKLDNPAGWLWAIGPTVLSLIVLLVPSSARARRVPAAD